MATLGSTMAVSVAQQGAQGDLFAAPLQRLRQEPVGRPRPASASEAAFQTFHAENPHVYRALAGPRARGGPGLVRSALAIRRALPFLHEWDADRYPVPYLRRGLLEKDVVEACVALLQSRWRAQVTVIDSGDARGRGRAARVIAGLGGNPGLIRGSASQMEPGISDLAVTFQGGRAGWFEIKRPAWLEVSPSTGRLRQRREPGRPTEEQLLFLERQRRAGAIVGVGWSPIDLQVAIEAAVAAA